MSFSGSESDINEPLKFRNDSAASHHYLDCTIKSVESNSAAESALKSLKDFERSDYLFREDYKLRHEDNQSVLSSEYNLGSPGPLPRSRNACSRQTSTPLESQIAEIRSKYRRGLQESIKIGVKIPNRKAFAVGTASRSSSIMEFNIDEDEMNRQIKGTNMSELSGETSSPIKFC